MIDPVKILGSLMANGVLSSGSGKNVLGNVLGAALGGGGRQGGGNSVMDMLGGVLGGGQQAGAGGGMAGAVLGSLLKGATGAGGKGGGLGGLFGGGQSAAVSAPQAPAGGGIGELLGGLLGGGATQGGLAALLSGAVASYAKSQHAVPASAVDDLIPSDGARQQAEQQADVLIRAMINAAKCDGQVDHAELQRITGKMGQLDQDEVNWLKAEVEAPLDVNAFINSVPRGMEQQVYAMSLMAIDLDSQHESRYLQDLARGLGVTADVANRLHEQLGAPKIFA